MIIKQKVADAMNVQIKSEFTASAQYTAIAVYFDGISLPELAGFFYRQAEEERMHAMKFVRFMLEVDTIPVIPATAELKNGFENPAEAVRYTLQQELRVTDEINNLVTLAISETDHASNQFLQWFVTEQVEEVDTMRTLLQTLEHAGGNYLLVEDFVRRNPQQTFVAATASFAAAA